MIDRHRKKRGVKCGPVVALPLPGFGQRANILNDEKKSGT